MVGLPLIGVVTGSGDNQRGAGFIDADAVHLIDDGKKQAPETQLLKAGIRPVKPLQPYLNLPGAPTQDQPVLQIIEGYFFIGAIGQVTAVGLPAFLQAHPLSHHPHGQAEGRVNRPHPLGIPPGQVVVHGDDMHRDAGQRHGTGRQRRHQGLALPGLHLGHHAVEQHPAAPHLYVKMTHPELPVGKFPGQGKGVRHQVKTEAAGPQVPTQRRGFPFNLWVAPVF